MNKLTKWNPLKLSPSWDPFREMEEMQNRLSSLFGRPWPAWRSEPEEGFTLTEWMPPVDIEESDREYLIKAELPGMKKEEVKNSPDVSARRRWRSAPTSWGGCWD
jgi:HSP20 family protein